MRKFLIFMFMAIGMIAFEQGLAQPNVPKKQIFPVNRYLQLKKVDTGAGTEKVLVRDTNGFVKEVNKTVLFNANAAVTPDLQLVLTNGNTYAGQGTYTDKYMELSNSYPFSEKIIMTANNGIELEAGTIAKTKLTHGALVYTYGGFTSSLVAPTDGNSGGGGVLTLPAVSGTVAAVMQGAPAVPNNFGKLGLLMTDGTYLYICISQGVWKKVLLQNL